MLERLARWLRVLGLDVASVGEGPDAAHVARARAEERVLLTRDRGIAREWPDCPCVVLDAGTPLAQLQEVVARFALARPDALFTRCLVCDALLQAVDEPDAPHVRHRCPRCGRPYWEGSHTRRMRAALARVRFAGEDG